MSHLRIPPVQLHMPRGMLPLTPQYTGSDQPLLLRSEDLPIRPYWLSASGSPLLSQAHPMPRQHLPALHRRLPALLSLLQGRL